MRRKTYEGGVGAELGTTLPASRVCFSGRVLVHQDVSVALLGAPRMLILGLPVMDGHELTQRCVAHIADTVESPASFGLLIVDNDSEQPYTVEEFGPLPFRVAVLRFSQNRGYYQPLRWMTNAMDVTSADLLALMHNDVLIYERGWDRRVREAFVQKADLGMVGFFGSDQVDERGGRGGGSMSNFNGRSATPAEAHGRRISGLEPALVLDSLFMATRVPCVPLLKIDDHTPICHFMDKVWPLRLTEVGWKVGVLGIDIDHVGGQTAVAMPRFEEEARKWCIAEGITEIHTPSGATHDPGGLMLYLEAERRFLTEMRDKRLVPARMAGWETLYGR